MDFLFLSQTALFRGCSPRETADMLQCLRAERRVYEKDRVICHAGDTVEALGLVLSGGVSNQYDRLRRGSVTDYLQFPHRRIKKRALVWNLADFMLLGGVVLTVLGLLRELIRK